MIMLYLSDEGDIGQYVGLLVRLWGDIVATIMFCTKWTDAYKPTVAKGYMWMSRIFFCLAGAVEAGLNQPDSKLKIVLLAVMYLTCVFLPTFEEYLAYSCHYFVHRVLPAAPLQCTMPCRIDTHLHDLQALGAIRSSHPLPGHRGLDSLPHSQRPPPRILAAAAQGAARKRPHRRRLRETRRPRSRRELGRCRPNRAERSRRSRHPRRRGAAPPAPPRSPGRAPHAGTCRVAAGPG